MLLMPSEEIKEKLEEQIGECLGLERAAQQAVSDLDKKGLLDKPGLKAKIEGMQKEAGGHESKLESATARIVESEELDNSKIEEHAEETVEKATQMMKIYLGEEPDTLDALEFLCLAEGGEVTHYEVLSKFIPKVKDKRFGNAVRSILKEEKRHLQMCTRLAKEHADK
jgi:ferritin-like metal-binding protein YciE